MNKKYLLSCCCLFLMLHLHAQQTAFEKFAEKQSDLFMKDYERKDTTSYQKHLIEFTKRYDQLEKPLQNQYRGFLQNAYYNLSCTYALLNKKMEALDYLQKSVDAGYNSYDHLLEDKDFENIRSDNRFQQIQLSVRSVGDYLYILKSAAVYNPGDKRMLPAFTYQLAGDSNLRVLRKTYNLDSIAGAGNDISKMINLMHWLHNLIPHDGNHQNPEIKNAASMITVCKKESRGLNCRGLATVLNECYLAMGFKSRFVTCLPKDSLKADNDCHVINMVYAPSLKKWLWMDPTNDAYVMNEKGELLSIQEVRERLINDQPLILNPTANWNNKFTKTKEDYLYNYMAKNLYLLECSTDSRFNTETTESGKTYTYISLVPLDYFNQQKNYTDEKREKTNTVIRECQTNNPAYFWQAPERE